MTRLIVVGSIHMDLITMASRFPADGETLLGERFVTMHGGKGANQAVAAARLGADVELIGALGEDRFGDALHDELARENVGLENVHRIEGCCSGTASITVSGGENRVVVVPGANAHVTATHVEAASALFLRADAVLVQMEIPLETVEATLHLGRRYQVPVILNPAPAQPLPATWLKQARYITPNQHQLAVLLGADPHADFLSLMQQAPYPVVVTRGAEGAWYRDQHEPRHQHGFDVGAVDSTGAGDTFNAAFAVFLHEGLPAAVRKACAAAALSVTRLGARGGMPHPAEVDALLARQRA